MSKLTKQGVRDLNTKPANGKKDGVVVHNCRTNVETIPLGRGFFVERCALCGETVNSYSEI